MKDLLDFDKIPIGSIWLAADGGSYGHKVVGKKDTVKGIIVQPFVLRQGERVFDKETTTIDWFKLQYRYYLEEELNCLFPLRRDR